MKKKALLIGAVIWGLIAVIGLGVFVMAMTGHFNFPRRSGWAVLTSGTQLVKEDSFSVKNLESLDFSTSHHSIVINLVAGDTLTVRQYDADADNLFTYNQSGNALSIKIEPRNLVGVMVINFNPRLEIDLPESYAAEIGLSTSSGTIRYTSEKTANWGDTAIKTSSGSVNFEGGIGCDKLEVSTSSGTIRLGEVKVSGKVDLNSSSGSINCGDVTAKSLNVSSSSGTLRFEDVKADSTVTAKTNSGSHNFGAVTCASFEIRSGSGTLRYGGVSGYGSINTNSGSVNCDKLDVKGDASITTGSGTVRVGLAERQNFELTITTGSGSISAGGLELFYKDERGHNAFGTVGNGSSGKLDIKTGSGSVRISNN